MYDDRETKTINELRDRLKTELDKDMFEDDYLFFRFLKYNDFDVDAAEQMLKQHLEWRKKHDVSNFLKYKIPEVLEKYLPNTKLGYDKQGCMVRYVPSGNTDWIGLFNSCKNEDLEKRIIYIHEIDNVDLKNQVKKFGKKAGRVLYIHNLENLSFTQATDKKVLANFINLITVYLNNYPKTLKAVIVINASMYFHLLYSLVKKFLPNAILQKVLIFSDDSFKEELLKRIDADVLPAFLGGNRTDPDGNPLCRTFDDIFFDFGISPSELKKICSQMEEEISSTSTPSKRVNVEDSSDSTTPLSKKRKLGDSEGVAGPSGSNLIKNDNKYLSCPLCVCRFTHKRHLLRHIRWHDNEASDEEHPEVSGEYESIQSRSEVMQASSHVNHGLPVPEKYYIHRSRRSLSNLPNVKKLTLSHAAFHEEFVNVTEPESYLEWEIEIKSRDIGFGLFYQDEDENKVELVPLQRINTDEYAESGIYKCHSIGTYIVLFDNTYSFIRSKVIYYKIKVLTAQDEASILAD